MPPNKLPPMTLEQAEQLWPKCDYGQDAVEMEGTEINTGDATAFFLEGYEYARKLLEQSNNRAPARAARRGMNDKMTSTYDSRQDTAKHMFRVTELIETCIMNLVHRAQMHDQSKLQSPEKEIFDDMTPKLKASTYGSEEYKTMLAGMKPALDHHYAENTHHPEHFPCGVESMSLLDILEMLCDWKAAGERHANGSIENSLKVNRVRFQVGDQLFSILKNTVNELGWQGPITPHGGAR